MATVYVDGGSFSCIHTFSCSEGVNVQLGLDWFEAYKKHCDHSNFLVPMRDSIVLDVCSEGSMNANHALPRSLAMDDNEVLAHLMKTISDLSSPLFVLYGAGIDDLQATLDKHGIHYEYNPLSDSCQQLLCHHILNGMCAKADGKHCQAIAGHYWSGKLAQLLSSTFLDAISEPNFPLDAWAFITVVWISLSTLNKLQNLSCWPMLATMVLLAWVQEKNYRLSMNACLEASDVA
ncbi:hypothetical protein L208DRAFT_1379572 [Tricholoma matsutake]|nr:hypothetical protein L208DRAFT_1379572 [Tricholoma matsutake 945]